MAKKKQCYDVKKVVNICGTLDKKENGKYILTIEDNENYMEYDLLADMLDGLIGQVVTISSDIY